MKIKTSITLSADVLREIERMSKGNRSEVVERALREFIERRAREIRDRRELEIINRYADELNKEAQDVLRDQIEL